MQIYANGTSHIFSPVLLGSSWRHAVQRKSFYLSPLSVTPIGQPISAVTGWLTVSVLTFCPLGNDFVALILEVGNSRCKPHAAILLDGGHGIDGAEVLQMTEDSLTLGQISHSR